MIDAAGGRIDHGLVDRVGQDRLQVAHEHREELGQHGLGAATLERTGLLTVQTVLQGVEIHVGELGNHKVVKRTVGARELVAGVGVVNLGLDLGQAGNHELVERQQVGKGDAVGLGLKLTLELGEQESATCCGNDGRHRTYEQGSRGRWTRRSWYRQRQPTNG